jgi:hypothetical protein
MSDCSLTLKIKAGNAIEAILTVKDVNGNLIDLGAAFAWSYSPGGTLTPISPVHVSLGTYSATFTATSPGLWVVRISDSATPPVGATVTVEESITVTPLAF